MSDPLTEVIRHLRPRAVFSKGISAAGSWAVRYAAFGHPGFCAVTQGACRLAVAGEAPVDLVAGDFVLLPATPEFTMSGGGPAPAVRLTPSPEPSERQRRHGRQDGPPDMQQIGGWFIFDAPDAALIVALLPQLIHLRGMPRLTQLVRLLQDEAEQDAPGRDLVLERLIEILLVEALRCGPAGAGPPGLMRGLADPRIAAALRSIHAELARPWTVAGLAQVAGQSRSAFFERFARQVGMQPMAYLQGWRMTVARDLLRRGGLAVEEVAARVGYGSSSTFSTAFRRHTGAAPGRYARQAAMAVKDAGSGVPAGWSSGR